MKDPDFLSFKIGTWIEASASGRLAVVLAFLLALAVVAVRYLA